MFCGNFVQVAPLLLDFHTPKPRYRAPSSSAEAPMGSPPPAYQVSCSPGRGSWAIVVTLCTSSWGLTLVQLVPPSILRNMPPLTPPARITRLVVPLNRLSYASARVRPPTLVGPAGV